MTTRQIASNVELPTANSAKSNRRYVTQSARYPAPPTLDKFRQRFDMELPASNPNYSDAKVSAMLEVAPQISSVSVEAMLYLTAHLLIVDAAHATNLDGGSGEVSSESLGPRTTSYVTMAKGPGCDVFYSQSSYGRMFMALESRSPLRMMPRVFG